MAKDIILVSQPHAPSFSFLSPPSITKFQEEPSAWALNTQG